MGLAPTPATSTTDRFMASTNNGPGGIVSLVCIACGNEKHFDQQVPNALACDKCGQTVWRQFATPTEPDEATIDQLDVQARSMAYGDPSPGTTVEEVKDLEGGR
jgi:hypothetical protein